MDKLKHFLLNLFFPKFCLGCQKEGSYLCQDCRSVLEINEFDYCLCSERPLIIGDGINSGLPTQAGKCQRCRDKKLSGIFCALPYKENLLVKNLIYKFKYQPYLKDLAKTLASILVEHFIISKKNTEEIWNNGILIPVPLDKKKIKFRGYNQAEELAKEIAEIIKIPAVSDNLIKIKSTKAQMELKKEEREKNLSDAFAIKNPELISGKKIFLVDDVYTTGSTMEECAKVLRQAGAKQVWGIALAREG